MPFKNYEQQRGERVVEDIMHSLNCLNTPDMVWFHLKYILKCNQIKGLGVAIFLQLWSWMAEKLSLVLLNGWRSECPTRGSFL